MFIEFRICFRWLNQLNLKQNNCSTNQNYTNQNWTKQNPANKPELSQHSPTKTTPTKTHPTLSQAKFSHQNSGCGRGTTKIIFCIFQKSLHIFLFVFHSCFNVVSLYFYRYLSIIIGHTYVWLLYRKSKPSVVFLFLFLFYFVLFKGKYTNYDLFGNWWCGAESWLNSDICRYVTRCMCIEISRIIENWNMRISTISNDRKGSTTVVKQYISALVLQTYFNLLFGFWGFGFLFFVKLAIQYINCL